MPKTTIIIPTINDSIQDFKRLFEIWRQVKNLDNVVFNFSQCNFLRPNALAFLGGVARVIQEHNGSIEFDWETLSNDWVKTTLCQNGFAQKFGHHAPGWNGHSIPYREDTHRNPNSIMDYLEDYWIGKGWVHVSERLKDAIVGNVWEIYNNAFEHGESSIGIFSCGQHFRHHNELTLAVIDFGIGIPNKVKQFFRDFPQADLITSAGYLSWAFDDGNTTKIDEPGGLGLNLLREFIQLNNGKLEIYSNDGYAIIGKDGAHFYNNDISFEGTIAYITLRCNETHYCFKDEVQHLS